MFKRLGYLFGCAWNAAVEWWDHGAVPGHAINSYRKTIAVLFVWGFLATCCGIKYTIDFYTFHSPGQEDAIRELNETLLRSDKTVQEYIALGGAETIITNARGMRDPWIELGEFEITAYWATTDGIEGGPVTASGLPVDYGLVAVDPEVIAIGSLLYIEAFAGEDYGAQTIFTPERYAKLGDDLKKDPALKALVGKPIPRDFCGYFQALDTGRLIVGRDIDIGFADAGGYVRFVNDLDLNPRVRRAWDEETGAYRYYTGVSLLDEGEYGY